MQAVSELELYIHIPFCVRKCAYCDFLSFPTDVKEEDRIKGYVSALLNEIEYRFKKEVAKKGPEGSFIVTSVFFGGGTPTLVKPDLLAEILDFLKKKFSFSEDAEISIECNPGTVNAEKLSRLRKKGFNRLSIGLQSALDKELLRIGRIHSFEQFLETYKFSRDAGFDNINVDIISALPDQTMDDVDVTLNRLLSLNPRPEHISAYSLILEPETRFMELYEKGKLKLPDEDEERRMHWHIFDVLSEAGYKQYELSNLSLPGFECRHNIGYWTGRNYLGFGLGAASYIKGRRFSNTRDMGEYKSYYSLKPFGSEPLNEYEELTKRDMMAEFMFLGLRMTEGISLSEFENRFGEKAFEVYRESLKNHISEGLLENFGDRVFLSRRGQDLANYVFADFLP